MVGTALLFVKNRPTVSTYQETRLVLLLTARVDEGSFRPRVPHARRAAEVRLPTFLTGYRPQC